MDIGNLNNTKNFEQNQFNFISENGTFTSNIPEAQISVSESCEQVNCNESPSNGNKTTNTEGDENKTDNKNEQTESLTANDSQNENMNSNQNSQKESSSKRKKRIL